MATEKQIYLDSIIHLFVSKDEARPAMMEPYLDGGNIVMTNAHVLLIAPYDMFSDNIEASSHLKFPNYKAVLMDVSGITPVRIPVKKFMRWYETIEKSPVYEDCFNCDGEGDRECDMGHMHECDACGGTGNSGKVIGQQVPSNKIQCSIADQPFAIENLRKLMIVGDLLGVADVDCYVSGNKLQMHIDSVTMLLAGVHPEMLDEEDRENLVTHPLEKVFE